MKDIQFLGDSLDVIRNFPNDARQEAGHQLDLVQRDYDPDDWKSFNTIGAGVKEIRIKEHSGAFRVIYVAKYADYIYVLNAFQKKTQKTPHKEIELAKKRLKEIQR